MVPLAGAFWRADVSDLVPSSIYVKRATSRIEPSCFCSSSPFTRQLATWRTVCRSSYTTPSTGISGVLYSTGISATMDSSHPRSQHEVDRYISEYMASGYLGMSVFTLMIWDHIITFNDEVEYIWKGSKGPIVYLFFLNRYLTPIAFAIDIFAYQSSIWTREVCKHFVRYEGAMTLVGINVASLMMLLRIHAIYSDQRFVVACVAVVFLVELSVNAWLLTKGMPAPHGPGLRTEGMHACTMIYNLGPIATASAWLPAVYDTLVFGLTLHRTFRAARDTHAVLVRALLHEGVVYYSIIFTVNVALTIMIISAAQDLKFVCAQAAYLLTVAMMSRITLHLKQRGSSLYAERWDKTMAIGDTDSGSGNHNTVWDILGPDFISTNDGVVTALELEMASCVEAGRQVTNLTSYETHRDNDPEARWEELPMKSPGLETFTY
ncbi:hypothetical protein B0H21DRAFT_888881 [Amylocystis lapponica]|nr:hypothetical protein B0H21DRAFT_888881 [Amylocystis lapponica]